LTELGSAYFELAANKITTSDSYKTYVLYISTGESQQTSRNHVWVIFHHKNVFISKKLDCAYRPRFCQ